MRIMDQKRYYLYNIIYLYRFVFKKLIKPLKSLMLSFFQKLHVYLYVYISVCNMYVMY